jgi:hypothetical protein
VNTGEQHNGKDLLIYLRMLAGERAPRRFFDVRWATPTGGMHRQFVSASAIHDGARLVGRLASRTDVYVGVALRDGRAHGGKSAISGSHLLYIECDDPDAAERLNEFPYSPSMIVASGTPGHLHIYWSLRGRVSNAQVESANRRLALALQGDPACVDIARVLRPPASMNHKHSPPSNVRLLEHNAQARHILRELTRGLPEDPQPPNPVPAVRSTSRRAGPTRLDRALLAIPAVEYVRVLAGLEPNRAGKVLCPFHRETDPSLQLYPDGSFYCFGSGCKKGGTIFDFAAATWFSSQPAHMPLRGPQFIEVRERLSAIFFGEHASG